MMKKVSVKLLSLLLAGIMLLSCFVACAESTEQGSDTDASTQAEVEEATKSEAQIALEALDAVDFGGKDLGILYEDGFKGEVEAINGTVDKEGGDDQTINDAVYKRNHFLEERCKLKFVPIASSAGTILSDVSNASMAGDGSVHLIDTTLMNSANFSVGGYLYNYRDLDVDIDQPWWDEGTADFELDGRVYFMSGDVNFADDNMTYVLLFNTKLREEYAATIPNPYDTVLNGDWTLEYFKSVIQNISADDGDGQWNEKDKYGFVTTWEFGNTFFIGSDLRYIVNDENGTPSLFLADASKMEKAMNVLKLSQSIYHENNATFMSPPGEEGLGLEIFKNNRALFYSEIASYLKEINRISGNTSFGVLPIPKYSKTQEHYRTWVYPAGSALSVSSAIKDPETMGLIVENYALLSSQYVKPAYYDITLTSKNIQDKQSKQMLDIIFQNRVYDMALYYQSSFGKYFDLFKTATYKNEDSFQSGYKSVEKAFSRNLSKFQKKLESLDSSKS